MPKIAISVILPLYNAAAYVEEAVQSILNQSFPDFELIIIDDCSTDNSCAIVQNIIDERIQLMKKPVNTGYTDSLNFGIKIAKGSYIARMDADDISHPKRLERQFQFLEAHPQIILCGTWFEILGSAEIIKHPITHNEIKVALLEYSAIGHPTVMFRKDFFQSQGLWYDKQMEPAEDYNLWVRASRIGQLYNLPEVLLKYRRHDLQASILQQQKQALNAQKARQFHWHAFHPKYIPLVDLTAVCPWGNMSIAKQKSYLEDFIEELQVMRYLNKMNPAFDQELLDRYCEKKKREILHDYFKHSRKMALKKLFLFLAPSTAYFRYFTNKQKQAIILNGLNPLKW